MAPGPGSNIKTASKAEERKILRNAEALLEDPSRLLPECVHDGAADCPLRKIEDKLDKTHGKRGDKKKLERASGGFFGHDLAKALASTLIVAEEGEAPYLGRVRLGKRQVSYVKRGKAPKETLAAVQHHDDPELRVLPLVETIRKEDLHVYSSRSGWWCTGRRADPPETFVEEMLDGLDAVRPAGDGLHTCPHVDAGQAGSSGPAHLVVTWTTAGERVALCEACAGDENVALALSRGIAAPEPMAEFAVDVHLPEPACRGHDDVCPAAEAHRSGFDTSGYLEGDLSDAGLLRACRKQVADRLTTGERFFLARDVCFGDDLDAMLDGLDPSELEGTALRSILEARDRPLVTGAGTANRLMAELWDDHARDLLGAVADETIVDEVLDAKDAATTPPGEILREARRRHDAAHMTDRLPTYADLPKAAQVADDIARTHRLEGRDAAIRTCEPERDWGTHAKGVGYGFLLALDAAGGEAWRFTEEERESGEFLAPRAETLLEVDPDGYHDALVAVARAAGVTASFAPTSEDDPD